MAHKVRRIRVAIRKELCELLAEELHELEQYARETKSETKWITLGNLILARVKESMDRPLGPEEALNEMERIGFPLGRPTRGRAS